MGRRVAVLGGGAMGTACAMLLCGQPETDVSIWLRNPQEAESLLRTRTNARYLPGVRLPDALTVTADAAAALRDADWVVAAVPTAYLRATLGPLAPLLPPGIPIVSVVKGIEIGTLLRPSQILRELFGARPVVALCGPSHAEEMVANMPASVVAASEDRATREAAVTLFTTARFRVYSSEDLAGVELAGALKNVVAIAAGVSDGLGFGDNAKASLLPRACVELGRFGQHLSARPGTFFGLAGIGDLITSCFSPHGRNRKIGLAIGRGLSLEDALATIPGVAEGVNTCRSVHEIVIRDRLEMPILSAVHSILFEGVTPLDAVRSLMTRPPRSESLTLVIEE